MAGRRGSVSIAPEDYAEWRASALGAITEEIEERLILRLAGDLRGKRVLDVGCGDGTWAVAFSLRGAAVVGVDADSRMLGAAKARVGAASARVSLAQAAAERLPFPDGAFDAVTAIATLCFVEDAAAAVGEMARVLRAEGRLVVGDLGKWSAFAAWRRLRGWLGSPTWRAARFRTPAELRALAEGCGLRVETVGGAVYYPPSGATARLLAPADGLFGRLTSFGAAFLALTATKPAAPR